MVYAYVQVFVLNGMVKAVWWRYDITWPVIHKTQTVWLLPLLWVVTLPPEQDSLVEIGMIVLLFGGSICLPQIQ